MRLLLLSTACWMRRGLGLLITVLLFSSMPVVAQSPQSFVITHYGSGNGLPQNSVNAITQTADGYLWFGTFNGLVRFDGLRFDVFSDSNTQGLGSARVGYLDAVENELFVGGFQSVRRFTSDDSPASSSSEMPGIGRILRIASNAEDTLYLLRNGEDLVRYHAGGYSRVGLPEGVEAGAVVGLFAGDADSIWLATSEHLYAKDETGWLVMNLPASVNEEKLRGLFGPSETDSPLLLTDSKLHRYSDGEWIELASLSRELVPGIQHLLLEGGETLWLAGDNIGLHFLSLAKEEEGPHRVYGLESNTVTALYPDEEGGVWVGTRNAGVHHLRPRTVFSFRAHEQLRSDITTAIVEDLDGSILYGSRGGGLFRIVDDAVQSDGHLDKGITTLLRDSRNRLWLGTTSGELWRRDYFGASWQRLPLELSSDDKRIFAITEVSDGEFWLAVQDGVVRYADDEVVLLGVEDGLVGNYVRDILQDSSGQIWLGTQESGLSRLSDGNFTNFTRENGLASNDAWHLYEDADSVIWAGSFGGGLNRIEDGVIQSFTAADGLPDNIIAAIQEDLQGRLWLGSAKGLFYLSEQSLQALSEPEARVQSRLLGPEAGAGHDEITGGYRQNVLLDSMGQLWFTTQTGVLRIDPQTITPSRYFPLPLIREFFVDGEPLAAHSEGGYALPPGAENIVIDYTAPSFTAASHIEFRYQLEGYDSEWIEAGTHRRATYSHLPPGSYSFSLGVRSSDGLWSGETTSFQLEVAPFFWQTLAFRVTCLILLFAILVLLIYWINLIRFRRRLAALERERALNDERIRIAQDLHDEMGSGLTHLHLLCEKSVADKAGESQLNSIGSKARELVRSMDEIVWSVDPRRDNLQSLFDYIMNYSESFLGAAGIRCMIVELPDAVEGCADSNERHQLLFCVKEVLNNVVKYAHCTTVTLGFDLREASCRISVSDDGRGFDPAEQNRLGNGLANLEQRMKSIGGSCEINSTIDVGTSVQLWWKV